MFLGKCISKSGPRVFRKTLLLLKVSCTGEAWFFFVKRKMHIVVLMLTSCRSYFVITKNGKFFGKICRFVCTIRVVIYLSISFSFDFFYPYKTRKTVEIFPEVLLINKHDLNIWNLYVKIIYTKLARCNNRTMTYCENVRL